MIGRLLHKDKVNGHNQAGKGGKVVPLQTLATEEDGGEECEDYQRDNLLHNLQLHQREGTSVAEEAYAVSGNLTRILGQSDTPRKDYHQPQRPR